MSEFEAVEHVRVSFEKKMRDRMKDTQRLSSGHYANPDVASAWEMCVMGCILTVDLIREEFF